MSWVSPTAYSDLYGTWNNENNAKDEITETYADSSVPATSYSNELELSRAAVPCDKVRVFVGHTGGTFDELRVRVLRDGGWVTVYQAAPLENQWKEISFTQGNVSALRVRFHNNHGFLSMTAKMFEADFWELQIETYTKTWNTDTIFKRIYEESIEADTVFKRLGVPAIASIDSLLMQKDILTQTLLNSILCTEGTKWIFSEEECILGVTSLQYFSIGESSSHWEIPVPFKVDSLLQADMPTEISIDTLLTLHAIPKTMTIDAFFTKLDIPITRNINVLLQKIGLTETADVDSLFKKLGIPKSVSVDTMFEITFSKERQINVLFNKSLTKSILINVIFATLATYTKQLAIDIVIKKLNIPKQWTTDALFVKAITKIFVLDTLMRKKDISIQKQLDGLFNKLNVLKSLGIDVVMFKKDIIKSFGIDAYLGGLKIYTLGTQLDVLFKNFSITETLSLDAVFGKWTTHTIQKQVDSFFKRLNISDSIDIDTLLRNLNLTKQFGIDSCFGDITFHTIEKQINTILKRLGVSETFHIDVNFLNTKQLQRQIDVTLQETLTTQKAVDVLFAKINQLKQLGIDVNLLKQNIVNSFQIDTRLGLFVLGELSRQFDTLFKKFGISMCIDINTNFSRSYDIQMQVDTWFGLLTQLSYQLDTLFKKLDLSKTLAMDTIISKTSQLQRQIDARFVSLTFVSLQLNAVFKKLDLSKTVVIDVWFGTVVIGTKPFEITLYGEKGELDLEGEKGEVILVW